jgi:hypothetical protein
MVDLTKVQETLEPVVRVRLLFRQRVTRVTMEERGRDQDQEVKDKETLPSTLQDHQFTPVQQVKA